MMEKSEAPVGHDAQQVLDHASAQLIGPLDREETLSRVAGAALPRFAEICTVFVPGALGEAARVAARHVDRHLEEAILAAHGDSLLDPEPFDYFEAMRTGAAQLVRDVTDPHVVGAVRSEEYLALMRRVGCRSLLTVPLIAHGKTFGALGFGRAPSSRPFDECDLATAEELARRAALVLDNARVFYDAQRANQAKDEFMAMLGHELRNPLAPIMTGLQLLKMKGLGSSRELDAMERQAKHLVRLVDDLLDISRIASDKLSLQKEPIEISRVIATAVDMVRPLIERGGHELRLSVPEHGLLVDADVVRLSQVLANLLTNAAKFTPPGGQLVVSATVEEDVVEVQVVDDGIGIAPELLPTLFEPFVQARATLARAHGGLGLGLAIVKSLVTLHSGTVSASSNGLGHGSTFIVRLPRVHVPSDIVGLAQPPSLIHASARGQKILIVDDNQDGAATLAEAVALLGYTAAVANDGQAALRIAQDFQPHAALLDLGLPDMNGYELGARLSLRHGPTLVIIALTGHGRERDQAETRAAGFAHHVTKPVSLDHLTELLSTAFSKKAE